MRNECSPPWFCRNFSGGDGYAVAASSPSHAVRDSWASGAEIPPIQAAQGISDLRPFLEPEAEELAKEDLLKREAEETAVGGATSAIGISFVLDIFCGRAWHDRVKKGGFKVGTNMKIHELSATCGTEPPRSRAAHLCKIAGNVC